MASVYTERFLYGEGVAVSKTYTVPENKRAIITHIACSKDVTPAAGELWLQVHGIWVVAMQLPGPLETRLLAVKLVAYERETVVMRLNFQPMSAMVCGYLFDDPVGNPAAHLELARDLVSDGS